MYTYGVFFPSTGSGDGAVLQLLPAGAAARRLQRHLLAQVSRQDHVGRREAARRRLRHLLPQLQVRRRHRRLCHFFFVS